MALQYIDWDIGDVTVINFSGRITLGEGTARLREAVQETLERGRRKIVLNFSEVLYVDSSGLGTLLEVRSNVMNGGGALKLMKLKEVTRDLLHTTRLHTLFEVYPDEDAAVNSFGE
jgi:anti-sigma B factor antagonist